MSAILIASLFSSHFIVKSVCYVTKTTSLSLSLPSPISGDLTWILSISSAVIGKGLPQRKDNHERNHFLFSLFLKYGVLLGHLEEEEEGASAQWAPTLGQALLSPLHIFFHI